MTLSIRGLCKGYPLGESVVEVLRGVDLEVPAGQLLAVMGPSGVGKSTLLNCVAGLERPDAGAVRVLGTDLGPLDEDERALVRRKSLGIVYQFWNLVPTLSARENVALPFLIDGAPPDEDAVTGALARVGMQARAQHLPTQLSGGEMQLVSIARAVVRKPPLLLADEPTGNVNVATGQRIMTLLTEVARETGCALVLVTHNPEHAARADRVVFMKDGVLCDEAELSGADVSSGAIHARLATLGI